MVQVVLDGINNILKMAGEEVEPVCHVIEECGGTLRHRVLNLSCMKSWTCIHSVVLCDCVCVSNGTSEIMPFSGDLTPQLKTSEMYSAVTRVN